MACRFCGVARNGNNLEILSHPMRFTDFSENSYLIYVKRVSCSVSLALQKRLSLYPVSIGVHHYRLESWLKCRFLGSAPMYFGLVGLEWVDSGFKF